MEADMKNKEEKETKGVKESENVEVTSNNNTKCFCAGKTKLIVPTIKVRRQSVPSNTKIADPKHRISTASDHLGDDFPSSFFITPRVTPCTSISSLVSDIDGSSETLDSLTDDQINERNELYSRIENFFKSLNETNYVNKNYAEVIEDIDNGHKLLTPTDSS